MEKSLIIHDLCKSFQKNNEEIRALNHVSTSFPKGKICGLLGNNGAGKTTLIKCVCGLLIPEHGQAFLGDADVFKNASARKKKLSVVLDGGRNLFWYMTVEENIRYFLMLKGQKYQADFIEQVMEQLGLTDLAKTQVQQLSFGMKQRAFIAVALAAHSDVIFMDEPTNGLDVQYKEELEELIRTLNKEYCSTFIISSHDMSFVENLCEYCVLIEKGQILHEGPLSTFYHAFNCREYRIIYRAGSLESIDLESLPINIIAHEKEIETLRLLWPQDRPLNELFTLMDKKGITIDDFNRSSGLASVISALTQSCK